MRMSWRRGMFLLLSSVFLLSMLVPGWARDRQALGRTDKYRVLVDKVLMAHNKWVMTEDHVREIARAGFNVVSPRLGNDNPEEVRKIAKLAEKHNMFHTPWMRGTMIAKGPVKMVWADGVEQQLASPNSDELWDWMTREITSYAKISLECPALIGVFLDYENYSPGGEGNCYGLSYDNKIMGEFAAAAKLQLPELAFADRAKWLQEKGLAARFAAFQINHWRDRCRQLKQAVDAINPTFQFCVYPAPGTLFITEGIYPEWGSAAAPLILADPYIYGRPVGLMPHAEALAANERVLADNQAYARARVKHLHYMGGIDPAVKGADPEFSGRNAAMSGAITDGYWIFYEGPKYDEDHPDYFRWFARANHAIRKGTAQAFANRPRQTPDPGDEATFVRQTDKPQVGVFDSRELLRKMIAKDGRFETHDLQGITLRYLKHFDVVILQNYNVSIPVTAPAAVALRKYVEEGGGVMLAHDTAWFMDSPFPEIATRGYPTKNVEAVRHVVDTDLKVTASHPALGKLQPGTVFKPEFRDHMIFRPGRQGQVVITNTFGDPVYVLGEVGQGKVAFLGQYHGYQKPLEGAEHQAFMGVVEWLLGK